MMGMGATPGGRMISLRPSERHATMGPGYRARRDSWGKGRCGPRVRRLGYFAVGLWLLLPRPELLAAQDTIFVDFSSDSLIVGDSMQVAGPGFTNDAAMLIASFAQSSYPFLAWKARMNAGGSPPSARGNLDAPFRLSVRLHFTPGSELVLWRYHLSFTTHTPAGDTPLQVTECERLLEGSERLDGSQRVMREVGGEHRAMTEGDYLGAVQGDLFRRFSSAVVDAVLASRESAGDTVAARQRMSGSLCRELSDDFRRSLEAHLVSHVPLSVSARFVGGQVRVEEFVGPPPRLVLGDRSVLLLGEEAVRAIETGNLFPAFKVPRGIASRPGEGSLSLGECTFPAKASLWRGVDLNDRLNAELGESDMDMTNALGYLEDWGVFPVYVFKFEPMLPLRVPYHRCESPLR